MRNKLSFLCLVLCSFLTLLMEGCSNKMTSEEYVKWMNDEANGLNKKKEIGDYVFEVQYKSPELMLLNDNRNQGMNSGRDSSRKEELTKMEYFDLKIKHRKGEDFIKTQSAGQSDYYNRLYYFSFGFQNDLSMEEGGNVYDCGLYHFERSYGLAASRTFVLGFEKPKKEDGSEDKTILINAHELGVGLVKIKFNQSDIENIPKVIL